MTTNFTQVFINNHNLRATLYSYLNGQDYKELSLVSKRFQRTQKKDYNDLLTLEFERYLKDLEKLQKKKPKKQIKGKTRCNIFSFDKKYLSETFKWTLINDTEQDNKEYKELQQDVIPSKFIKDYSWKIFYSPVIKKYICVSRTLADPSLEFFYKQNQSKKLDDQALKKLDSNEIDYYSLFHDNDNLDISKYDKSANGLLMRQKETQKLIEAQKSEKKAQKITNKQNYIENLPDVKKMSLIMLEGGSMSLGVFECDKEITHRSDHKYVVRGKGGGKRQSVKDKSKSIKSMGSTIRRNNEKKHSDNVQSIMEANMEHLKSSDQILIHAPGENEAILFDEGRALNDFKKENKVRSICQTLKKANYTEVKRIYDDVIKMYIFDDQPK